MTAPLRQAPEASQVSPAVHPWPSSQEAPLRISQWPSWDAPSAIEQALKDSVVEGLGIKPRKAFAPVRVAVTGRTVSPPLYESMELLGRDVSLARLRKENSELQMDRAFLKKASLFNA